jgi:hypothetical protein
MTAGLQHSSVTMKDFCISSVLYILPPRHTTPPYHPTIPPHHTTRHTTTRHTTTPHHHTTPHLLRRLRVHTKHHVVFR